MGRLVPADRIRKATATQITKVCRRAYVTAKHRYLKQMGYSTRKTHQVPLLSAKNWIWTPSFKTGPLGHISIVC